jgi:hypothetical protein
MGVMFEIGIDNMIKVIRVKCRMMVIRICGEGPERDIPGRKYGIFTY